MSKHLTVDKVKELLAAKREAQKTLKDVNAQCKAAGIVLPKRGKTEDNVKHVYPLLKAGKATKDVVTSLISFRTKDGAKFSKSQATHVVAIVSATMELATK